MQKLGAVIRRTDLPATTLALAQVRASQINGCSVCLDMHVRELKASGEPDERITLSNPGPGAALSGRWQLDPRHSSVEFRVATFWGLATVKGHFERFEGRLELGAIPAIELTIDAASLQTRNRRRDNHLRSADFFDAENHPHVRFVAGAAELHEGTLRVRGDLSAGGRSIPLEVEAQVRNVEDGVEIEATATAAHRELGMAYNPLGKVSSSSELLVKGRLTPA